jgi:hypothetical protein
MNRALIGQFCKFIGAVCIFAVLILVGVLLSGPSESERKLQRITCINNLKQIGIAFRLWEGDHGDQFPFNVSTNAGGTMELCAVGKDGFDSHAALHLRVMSNELTVPKILVCPQDRSRKPATDFSSLQATNVSYHFYSGTNITETNPQTVLAICPIHGNLLFCDGTVREEKKEPEPGTLDRLSDRFQYDNKLQARLACTSVILAAGLGLLLLGGCLKVKAGKAEK